MEYEVMRLNKELTNEFFDNNQGFIEKKQCYNNVANICIRYISHNRDKYKNIKIIFGAIKLYFQPNIYIRHCFFEIDGSVVDPTYPLLKQCSTPTYLKFIEFSFDNYIEKLYKLKEGSLNRITMPIFNKIAQELFKENIILIG